MIAVIGASIFTIIGILTLLASLGVPVGEFTMGGRNKVLPTTLRYMAMASLFIQLFAIFIILQAGGILPLWFTANATKYICFFFAVYLVINSVMNAFSTSKKEKYVMTPLAAMSSICFWITGFMA